jgi:uncharacterized protein
MIHYLDTSAALKLVIDEAESVALARHLTRVRQAGDDLIASMLMFTELHCAATRRGAVSREAINGVLDAITLVDVQRGDLLRAATSAWGLRSADAIHLAVALRLEVDTVIAYDAELSAAARLTGVTVAAPGSASTA